MKMNRRNLIKTAGATALMSAAAMGRPAEFTAHAADTSGYKALVCLFLFGGVDGHDVLIPTDAASYDQYSGIRQSLLSSYGSARARENLLDLGNLGPDVTGGRRFGLPPEMPQLHALYQAGQAAIVPNVGPLIEPVTKSAISAETATLPRRLFSHNDQQSTWLSGSTEGAQLGWGGLFADAILSGNGNTSFSTIDVGNGGLFLTGDSTLPYRVSSSGPSSISLTEDNNGFAASVEEHLRFSTSLERNLISRDVMSIIRNSIDDNAFFKRAFDGSNDLRSSFEGNNLSNQLRTVARTISIRSQLQASRQIFFVFLGGFDSHSAQASGLPPRLARLDNAIGEFQTVMNTMGLTNDVTLFTASDFGRTLAINGDGTDHGWGNHHFVVGGGVNGGRVYGDIAPPLLDGDFDVGGGRLIPQWSVEQMASPLGEWFGLSPAEIRNALPNVANFDAGPSGLFSGSG